MSIQDETHYVNDGYSLICIRFDEEGAIRTHPHQKSVQLPNALAREQIEDYYLRPVTLPDCPLCG